MESNLNKPLKRYSERRQAGATTRGPTLLATAVLLAVMVLPFAWFYGAFALLQPESAETTEISATRQEPATEPEEPDTGTKNVAKAADPEDGNNALANTVENAEPVPVPTPKAGGPKIIRRQPQALAHLPDPELSERGASGIIPKRGPDGLRAMDVYARQPDTEGNFGVARVVLVIGGLGISQTTTQNAIRDLPPAVTLAFAPYGNSLSRWMRVARKKGHELLLQLPMQPLDFPRNNPGRHTLRTDADHEENLANLHWAMSRITNYVGVMNFLGGRFLGDPAAMKPVFDELADRGVLFFEDGSVNNSIGAAVAEKSLLPYARAQILLDNVRSRKAIIDKLDKLAAEAKRTGLAVGFGNAFPETVSLVSQFAEQAGRNGIEVTPLSAVVKDPAQ